MSSESLNINPTSPAQNQPTTTKLFEKALKTMNCHWSSKNSFNSTRYESSAQTPIRTIDPNHKISTIGTQNLETSDQSKIKNSLTFKIKKNLKEIKNEAEEYLNARNSIKHHLDSVKTEINEKSETLETDAKDSFFHKTFGKPSTKPLEKPFACDDLENLKEEIEKLMKILSASEEKAQNNHLENIKLKETVHGLENKIENMQFYDESPKVICGSKCITF